MENRPLVINPGHGAVEGLAHISHGLEGELAEFLELRSKLNNEVRGLLARIGLTNVDAAKEVDGCPIEGVEDVPNLIALLSVLFPLGQGDLPGVLVRFFEQVSNTHVLVVQRVQVAFIAMALNITHMNTDTQDVQKGLAVLLHRITKCCLDMVGVREAPTRNESGIGGGRLTSLGEPLEVVRIVDNARFNGLTRVPGEGRVTGNTPHLVTAIDFRYHLPATRTGLRILPNKSRRR